MTVAKSLSREGSGFAHAQQCHQLCFEHGKEGFARSFMLPSGSLSVLLLTSQAFARFRLHRSCAAVNFRIGSAA